MISSRSQWLNYVVTGGHLVVNGDGVTVSRLMGDYQWRRAEMSLRVWRIMAILAGEKQAFYEFPHGMKMEVDDEHVTLLADTPIVFPRETFCDLAETFLQWNGDGDLPPIVLQAILHNITDIGQLSPCEHRQLKNAIDSGLLATHKGGPFNKTVYHYRMLD